MDKLYVFLLYLSCRGILARCCRKAVRSIADQVPFISFISVFIFAWKKINKFLFIYVRTFSSALTYLHYYTPYFLPPRISKNEKAIDLHCSDEEAGTRYKRTSEFCSASSDGDIGSTSTF